VKGKPILKKRGRKKESQGQTSSVCENYYSFVAEGFGLEINYKKID